MAGEGAGTAAARDSGLQLLICYILMGTCGAVRGPLASRGHAGSAGAAHAAVPSRPATAVFTQRALTGEAWDTEGAARVK